MIRRIVRRIVASALFCVLRARARPLRLPPADAILLVIAPHPDDESLGCARLIAAHGDAGGCVHLAWITDGEASHPEMSPSELAARRRAEGVAAAAVLGVAADRCHHFAAPDGRLTALSRDEEARLVGGLTELIIRLRPTEVLVTSAFDGSTEHSAAHAFARAAVARLPSPPPLRTYLVWAHWNVRALTRICRRAGVIWWRADPRRDARRRVALEAHVTQVQPLTPGEAPLLTRHFLACFPAHGEFYLDG